MKADKDDPNYLMIYEVMKTSPMRALAFSSQGMFNKEGYYVCEVNSNAFFGGIESVSGINIAKAYCQYIYQTIYEI